MLSSKKRLKRHVFGSVAGKNRINGKLLSVSWVLGGLGQISVIVSKKTEKLASALNKIRRRVYSATETLFLENGGAVFFIKKGLSECSGEEIKKEVYSLLKKTNLLVKLRNDISNF